MGYDCRSSMPVQVVETACSLAGEDALEFLFNRDPNIRITEDVVKAAACSLAGKDALEFLFNRDPSIRITEDVVMTAVFRLELLYKTYPSFSPSQALITTISEQAVWDQLWEVLPVCFYGKTLLGEILKEEVAQEVAEVKLFLETLLSQGRNRT